MTALDNTNASVEARKHWIDLAQELSIPIRCIRFTASARLCEHNDAVRALNPNLVRQSMMPLSMRPKPAGDDADHVLCIDES
jgi:predicted kinase